MGETDRNPEGGTVSHVEEDRARETERQREEKEIVININRSKNKVMTDYVTETKLEQKLCF